MILLGGLGGAYFISSVRVPQLLVFIASELVLWRLGLWAAVIITDDHLIVRGFYRTHKIPWNEIKEIRATNMLQIDLLNGQSITAIAVQQANINAILRKEGFLVRQ